jgi:sugar phosphate isomerase/epimerase
MLLLSTSSLSWYSLHRIFSFAKKGKYDWIEITLNKLQYDLWDEDYIKGLSDAFNIPVLSITAPVKWMNEKAVDKIIKIATTVNAHVVTFSPPHLMDKNTRWFSFYLQKIKKDTNLSIAIQNVEPKFMFFIIPEYKNSTLWELKKVTGDATLDIAAIDPTSGMDILKAQKILGSNVKNIFFSDRRGTQMWLLPGSAGGWISYLPLESFFMKLKTSGYNGHVTLKIKQTELWAGNEERVLQNLEYAKNYYEKHFLDYK